MTKSKKYRDKYRGATDNEKGKAKNLEKKIKEEKCDLAVRKEKERLSIVAWAETPITIEDFATGLSDIVTQIRLGERTLLDGMISDDYFGIHFSFIRQRVYRDAESEATKGSVRETLKY